MRPDEAQLTITLRSGYDEPIAACVTISNYVMERMKAVDVCQDPMSRFLSGPSAVSVVEYERVKMERNELAKMIAEKVTNELMKFMASRDLEQGYNVEQLGRPVGGGT